MTNQNDSLIHEFYQHTEQAFSLIPMAITSLTQLKQAFEVTNEDFLAIEMKTMIERLKEIQQLLAEGPQG